MSPTAVVFRRFLIPMAIVMVALATIGAGCAQSDSTAGGTADSENSSVGSAAEGAESPEASGADNASDGGAEGSSEQTESTTGGTVRLITHDSFALPEDAFDAFTDQTGYTVELSQAGDAGELVSRAILTAGQPEADVLFGVDNTFLQRALDNNIFVPYKSSLLGDVPDELKLDAENRATPIDYGDVCVNYNKEALSGETVPTSIAELAESLYPARFVTEDPQTSSPGFAFLLATIETFGPEGWEDYWQKLADGGTLITSGWSDAYYDHFGPGDGQRPFVTSYASSPVAEFVYATDEPTEPPTGVITDGCFRQVEFAGVLAGTDQAEIAGKLIDYLLSPEIQGEIPLNMFVLPANATAEVPEVYQQWAASVDDPVIMDPATIEANRDEWIERWVEIVLR